MAATRLHNGVKSFLKYHLEYLYFSLFIKDAGVFLGGRGQKFIKFADGGGKGSIIVKICRCLKWMVPNMYLLFNHDMRKAMSMSMFCILDV